RIRRPRRRPREVCRTRRQDPRWGSTQLLEDGPREAEPARGGTIRAVVDPGRSGRGPAECDECGRKLCGPGWRTELVIDDRYRGPLTLEAGARLDRIAAYRPVEPCRPHDVCRREELSDSLLASELRSAIDRLRPGRIVRPPRGSPL